MRRVVIGAALGALAVLLILWQRSSRDRELTAVRDSVRFAVKAETLAYHDTVRLKARVITLTRSVTDTLLRRDTVVHTDTVRVLVAAERAACDSALAIRDRHIVRQDSALRSYDKTLEEAIRRGRPSPIQFGPGIALTPHGFEPAFAIIVRVRVP